MSFKTSVWLMLVLDVMAAEVLNIVKVDRYFKGTPRDVMRT